MSLPLLNIGGMDIHIPSELVQQAERWTELKLWERRELGRGLRKLGLTFAEIRDMIPISKSTLSGWCRDIDMTPAQIERIQIFELEVSRGPGEGGYQA